ncbi:MAG: cation diffusion facilitator family transporter [Thermoplasmatales archaeon]|nr:MAG: cation diffusion facilitator family transporter [Thermoplasmatales archaeon]
MVNNSKIEKPLTTDFITSVAMAKSEKSRIIPSYGNINDPVVRAKYGYLEATISIVGNTALFLLKLFLGLFINSIALIADAFHTLSDVGTSGVVIFGFKLAKQPSDIEHPFGHGRVEYIATLIIAILLVITGVGFIQQSIERIINNIGIINQEFAIIIGIIIIVSSIIKEAMARFSFALGEKINSDVLIADAWHHRSDVFASIAVGISIIASSFGYPFIDAIFGIIVSFIIIYVGINLARTSSNFLVGQAPDNQLIKEIKEVASQTKNVKGIHDISLHDYGTTKIVTLHAEVDDNLSLEKAHKTADELEKNIQDKTKYSTVIHIDPTETLKNIKDKKRVIEALLEKQKEIKSFHKIRIIHTEEKDNIKMHLVVDEKMPIHDSHTLCNQLKTILEKKYGPCKLDIHFDPCIKNCKICTIFCLKRTN